MRPIAICVPEMPACTASTTHRTKASTYSITTSRAYLKMRPSELAQPPGIFRNSPAVGKSRVVCYGPLHNTTLAELPVAEIRLLLECWQQQYRELGALPTVNHVLIFENKGKVVGVSNPHPHCQIYATNFVFKTIAVEVEAGERYSRDQAGAIRRHHLRRTGRRPPCHR